LLIGRRQDNIGWQKRWDWRRQLRRFDDDGSRLGYRCDRGQGARQFTARRREQHRQQNSAGKKDERCQQDRGITRDTKERHTHWRFVGRRFDRIHKAASGAQTSLASYHSAAVGAMRQTSVHTWVTHMPWSGGIPHSSRLRGHDALAPRRNVNIYPDHYSPVQSREQAPSTLRGGLA